jgi:DNA-binding protein H-NS
MDIQLEHLSLSELQVLRSKVDQELEKRQSEIRKEGLEKIKQLAAEYGLSVDELKALANPTKTSAKRGSVPPKYRDPSNPKNTWTGRGRKPKWVEAYLASNGSLDEIAI